MAEGARVGDIRRCKLQLLRQVRREANDLRELTLDISCECLDLGRVQIDVGERRKGGCEVRIAPEGFRQAHALEPANKNPQRAIRHFDHLVDDRHRADVVDVREAGLVDCGIPRRNKGDESVTCDNIVDQCDRAILPNRERCHRLREHDGVFQRKHGQRAREHNELVATGLAQVKRDARHAAPTAIEMRPAAGTCSATGSETVMTPRS